MAPGDCVTRSNYQPRHYVPVFRLGSRSARAWSRAVPTSRHATAACLARATAVSASALARTSSLGPSRALATDKTLGQPVTKGREDRVQHSPSGRRPPMFSVPRRQALPGNAAQASLCKVGARACSSDVASSRAASAARAADLRASATTPSRSRPVDGRHDRPGPGCQPSGPGEQADPGRFCSRDRVSTAPPALHPCRVRPLPREASGRALPDGSSRRGQGLSQRHRAIPGRLLAVGRHVSQPGSCRRAMAGWTGHSGSAGGRHSSAHAGRRRNPGSVHRDYQR